MVRWASCEFFSCLLLLGFCRTCGFLRPPAAGASNYWREAFEDSCSVVSRSRPLVVLSLSNAGMRRQDRNSPTKAIRIDSHEGKCGKPAAGELLPVHGAGHSSRDTRPLALASFFLFLQSLQSAPFLPPRPQKGSQNVSAHALDGPTAARKSRKKTPESNLPGTTQENPAEPGV